MLNPFPELLNFALFSPLIFRLVLGMIFIDLGILKFKSERNRWGESFEALSLQPSFIWVSVYGVLQIAGGIMLIIGFWTQIAALVFAIFTFFECYIEWRAEAILKRNIVFYIMLLAMAVSLLFTGAGFLSVDLPL